MVDPLDCYEYSIHMPLDPVNSRSKVFINIVVLIVICNIGETDTGKLKKHIKKS